MRNTVLTNEKYSFPKRRHTVHHHCATWRKAKKEGCDTSSADKIHPLMEVSGSVPQIGMSKTQTKCQG